MRRPLRPASAGATVQGCVTLFHKSIRYHGLRHWSMAERRGELTEALHSGLPRVRRANRSRNRKARANYPLFVWWLLPNDTFVSKRSVRCTLLPQSR